MKCFHILPNGKCDGMYHGFMCIGEKCRADKEPPCANYDKGFYCTKFRRFGCVGVSRCGGTLEEYMRVANPEKARS